MDTPRPITAFLAVLFLSLVQADASPRDRTLQPVLIQISSPRELAALKRMPVDIVRVRRHSGKPSTTDDSSVSHVVEAVATPGVIEKLRRQGFRITIPEPAKAP